MSRLSLPSLGRGGPAASSDLGEVRPSLPGAALAGALVLTVVAFLALGVRLLDVGAGDLNIAGLFSTDEQLAGVLVQAMVRHGDLGLSHFFSYGPLDLYAARLLLWPYGLVRPVSDQAVLVALRLVSLLAGAGCLLLTYLLGRRLWSAAVGVLAAVLLALCPTLLAWSTTSHPDTLQLLFLLLGLRLAIELPGRPNRRTVVLASAFAALAFAAKYGGVFLLPVIWLAAGVGALHTARLRSWFRDVTLSALVFTLLFLLVDPSVLLEPRRFLSQARLESELAHNGHLFAAVASPVGWLRLLGGGDLLGPLGLVLGLGGLIAWSLRDLGALPNPSAPFPRNEGADSGQEAKDCPHPSPLPVGEGILTPPSLWEGTSPPRRGVARGRAAPAQPSALRPQSSSESSGRLLLAAWTLGYLLLLLVWVADRQPRYALPVLPGLVLYAAATIVWLAQRLPAPGLVLAVLVVSLAAPLGPRLASYERAQARRMDSPSIAARIAAGRWLAGQAGAQTAILYDAYAYLPPSFEHTHETFGLTPAQINAFRPQIILTDAEIGDRFRDSSRAGAYRDGAGAFREIRAAYAALQAGALPCYPLLRGFGSVQIYGRVHGGAC